MLPKRADPAFGALVGTLVLVAFLAPPLLILALIVWLAVRAERKSSLRAKPEEKRRRKRARSATV